MDRLPNLSKYTSANVKIIILHIRLFSSALFLCSRLLLFYAHSIQFFFCSILLWSVLYSLRQEHEESSLALAEKLRTEGSSKLLSQLARSHDEFDEKLAAAEVKRCSETM